MNIAREQHNGARAAVRGRALRLSGAALLGVGLLGACRDAQLDMGEDHGLGRDGGLDAGSDPLSPVNVPADAPPALASGEDEATPVDSAPVLGGGVAGESGSVEVPQSPPNAVPNSTQPQPPTAVGSPGPDGTVTAPSDAPSNPPMQTDAPSKPPPVSSSAPQIDAGAPSTDGGGPPVPGQNAVAADGGSPLSPELLIAHVAGCALAEVVQEINNCSARVACGDTQQQLWCVAKGASWSCSFGAGAAATGAPIGHFFGSGAGVENVCEVAALFVEPGQTPPPPADVCIDERDCFLETCSALQMCGAVTDLGANIRFTPLDGNYIEIQCQEWEAPLIAGVDPTACTCTGVYAKVGRYYPTTDTLRDALDVTFNYCFGAVAGPAVADTVCGELPFSANDELGCEYSGACVIPFEYLSTSIDQERAVSGGCRVTDAGIECSCDMDGATAYYSAEDLETGCATAQQTCEPGFVREREQSCVSTAEVSVDEQWCYGSADCVADATLGTLAAVAHTPHSFACRLAEDQQVQAQQVQAQQVQAQRYSCHLDDEMWFGVEADGLAAACEAAVTELSTDGQ